MRKQIPYLLSLAMALVMWACTQPAGTQQNTGDTPATSNTTSQFYTHVDNEASEQPDVQKDNKADQANQQSEVQDSRQSDQTSQTDSKVKVKEKGKYTDKERVALYIHTYGHLPDNYITKAEAQKLGWDSRSGNLRKVAPGKSIGGDKFGNYEGQLPQAKKRKYYECDIDYGGGKRNAKRIVFSNDGLIFYTDDHYRTFEQLY
ncbi:MAG: hypothetical protein K6F33_10905 [Bacteroidales bacterium]|nr:hypothetical protein [Bacteroidales bacterium]